MAFFTKSASKNKWQSNEDKGWVDLEGGYEATSSIKIIKNILHQLKKEGLFLTVIQKKYQSSGTILIDFGQNRIKIDKPKDWPGNKGKTVITFRDASKVRYYFQCDAISFDENSLYLQFPERVLRLQRRINYRVDLPPGSKAEFKHKGKNHLFYVKDVSAGGMLIYGNNSQEKLEKDNILEDIVLIIPSSADEDGSQGGNFPVGSGKVVRKNFNQNFQNYYLGINFLNEESSKKELIYYLRQRELEILRKGMK